MILSLALGSAVKTPFIYFLKLKLNDRRDTTSIGHMDADCWPIDPNSYTPDV